MAKHKHKEHAKSSEAKEDSDDLELDFSKFKNLFKSKDKKEKKEIERIKAEIEKLEADKKSLSEKMNAGKLSNDELIKVAADLQKINDSLDEKVMRLLELEEALANLD